MVLLQRLITNVILSTTVITWSWSRFKNCFMLSACVLIFCVFFLLFVLVPEEGCGVSIVTLPGDFVFLHTRQSFPPFSPALDISVLH